MASPDSPSIVPSSPTFSVRSTAGRQGAHHRRQSSSILASIIHTATAVFTSPNSQHAVLLDDEAKFGDYPGGEAAEMKRVELKIGGMTVSPILCSTLAIMLERD